MDVSGRLRIGGYWTKGTPCTTDYKTRQCEGSCQELMGGGHGVGGAAVITDGSD